MVIIKGLINEAAVTTVSNTPIVFKGKNHPENLPRNKPFPVDNQGIKIPNVGSGIENKVVQKLMSLNQNIDPKVMHN